MENRIVFIGAGEIAEAMIAGFLSKDITKPEQITATNRSNRGRLKALEQNYHIRTASAAGDAAKNADVIILAVKPKDLAEALLPISSTVTKDTLLISVLAGVSSDKISALLDHEVPVIRAMPNTSAAIGYSATGLAAGKFAGSTHLLRAQTLFNCIGTTIRLDEEHLHAVTGLSGSGPAYLYYMAEALYNAASSLKLDETDAKELIVQTLLGAAHMLKTSKERPEQLREKITSPGGTTEAGVDWLDTAGVKTAIETCVKKAVQRSIELGKLE